MVIVLSSHYCKFLYIAAVFSNSSFGCKLVCCWILLVLSDTKWWNCAAAPVRKLKLIRCETYHLLNYSRRKTGLRKQTQTTIHTDIETKSYWSLFNPCKIIEFSKRPALHRLYRLPIRHTVGRNGLRPIRGLTCQILIDSIYLWLSSSTSRHWSNRDSLLPPICIGARPAGDSDSTTLNTQIPTPSTISPS